MTIESPSDSGLGLPQDTTSALPPGRKQPHVSVAAIFGLALLSAFWLGLQSPPSAARLSASSLDFGDAWAAPDFQWVITLTNPGRQDVNITHFQSTCRCTSITPQAVVIPAGESAPITLHLDLTSTGPQDITTPVRPFEVSITATVSGSGVIQGPWVVNGVVRPPFVASQQEVRFAQLLVHGEPLASSSVTIRPSTKAHRVHASCQPALATTAIRALQDETFTLEVTPSASLPVGAFSIPVTISIDDESGQQLPSCAIFARGEIVSDIYALPSTIDYSIVAPNTRTSQSITLQTHLGTEFRVVDSESEDSNLQARSLEEPIFATRHHVEVSGTVSHQGSYRSGISLSIETKDGQRRTLQVPVRGYVVTR